MKYLFYCGNVHKVSENSNPLDFWKDHAKTLPLLSQLSKKLFCILATSVPSEELFSSAAEVITDRRNRLKPSNAEKLTLLDQDIAFCK